MAINTIREDVTIKVVPEDVEKFLLQQQDYVERVRDDVADIVVRYRRKWLTPKEMMKAIKKITFTDTEFTVCLGLASAYLKLSAPDSEE